MTYSRHILASAVLAVLGAITQLLTTQTACAFLPSPAAVLDTPGCAAWLEPPLKFKDIFHPNIAAEHLQVRDLVFYSRPCFRNLMGPYTQAFALLLAPDFHTPYASTQET